ncbi:carbonic anhydrase [Oceanobacillus locisalsi]|uniref:Carbonic anhydrase n=1 Tax=Oceanobacillus locisalsi TaxID=546107 RepID=A0ABW3NKV9_9BACI
MKRFKWMWISVFLSITLLTACSGNTITEEDSAEGSTDEAEEEIPPAEETEWSYTGETGPDQWDTLHPEYLTCAEGQEQSPIDIDLAKVKLDETLNDIEINYQPTAFTLENTGHTIQLNDPTGSNTIIVEGEEYSVQQLHFHIPSENAIDGQFFDMEGHIVHNNENGDLAVLGFMIEAGEENKTLAEAWSKMPEEKTEEDVELDNLINLHDLLPEDLTTFRFSGSLTTPPCTEGVNWLLLEEPISYSQEQIDTFGEIFSPHNHRTPQPLNDREVHTH